jgi:hypothetical protein
MIIWGIITPAVFAYFLFRNRFTVKSIETRIKYGYMFIGKTDSRFYWEFVIMIRKMLIAFVQVALVPYGSAVQGLVAFMVLAIALRM